MKNLTPLAGLALRDVARFMAKIITGLTTFQSARGALLHHWDFNTTNDPVDVANMTLVANPAGELALKNGHIVKDTGDCCMVLPVNHLNIMHQLRIHRSRL
jgi:hypothetical protein